MIYFFIILILVYIILRFSAKFLLPWLLKYYLKKVEKTFAANNPEHPYTKGKNKITIDYIPKTKSKSSDHIGEYVDYEEIP